MMWNPHQSSVIVASRNASMTRSPRFAMSRRGRGRRLRDKSKGPTAEIPLNGTRFSVQTLGLAATQLTTIRRGANARIRKHL